MHWDVPNEPWRGLIAALAEVLPHERIIRDPLRTLAYGTDASFYRLIPKIVVKAQSEAEVAHVMRACAARKIHYTFRAAGTSLSGQSLSDSVLIQLSRQWNDVDVAPDGLTARFQPAVLGIDANRALACHGRRIGPDPASLDSAMIGGIAANNSSGMCCGNVQDTYHTMASLRVLFADGAVLDTGSEASRAQFAATHGHLLAGLSDIAARVAADPELAERIRRKFRIKNTTGYSLNALVDFTDPVDILAHLMIGSEGTLGFISEIVYRTVPDYPFHATALIYFDNIQSACAACVRLGEIGVAAAELMDRPSLRSIEAKPGIPAYVRDLPPDAAALLVEVQAENRADLEAGVSRLYPVLDSATLLRSAEFTFDHAESKALWAIRKGLFPSLGYSRKAGTTIIIEDIAVPVARLAQACGDLRRLLELHGYPEAIIFGHALQGNVHFVFCPDFGREEEVRRYADFMSDVTSLIVGTYDGSLKAEHGTGRNMAPFVELEWGPRAYALMREIKRILDPGNLLNPGVILNDDPQAHIRDLKELPASDPAIEKCTECGFCERTCPSRNLSLTPRQRIVSWREISRLTATGSDPARLAAFRHAFEYQGDETCAVDGLCATLCPVGIDTGAFIKEYRHRNKSARAKAVAAFIGRHLNSVSAGVRLSLRAAALGKKVLGNRGMAFLTAGIKPAWNPWVPGAAHLPKQGRTGAGKKVVCFPSCVNRVFGSGEEPQHQVFERLLERCGYEAFYPENLSSKCCGMAFSSKGFTETADAKAKELYQTLKEASKGGEYPIVIDTSPCTHRMLTTMESGLRLFDTADFILQELSPHLRFTKRLKQVAVHVPCSSRKMHNESSIIDLAKRCAEEVYTPNSVPCCGFAGDRGFQHPELPATALISIKKEIPATCQSGYSSSRMCEIGVSLHSGIEYQSIVYLVDRATAQ